MKKKNREKIILSFVNKIISSAFNLEIREKTKKKTKKENQFSCRTIAQLPHIPTIIDIGIGDQGTNDLYSLFPDSSYVFIDPVEECREAINTRLKQKNNFWINAAVGATNTTTEIHVANKYSRSSIHNRSQTTFVNLTKEVRTVKVERLDSIIERLPLQKPYGIKIDTEGFELEVLKGAKYTLQDTLFVILELHYWVNYTDDDIPNLQSIINKMNESNFYACQMLGKKNLVFVSSDLSNFI